MLAAGGGSADTTLSPSVIVGTAAAAVDVAAVVAVIVVAADAAVLAADDRGRLCFRSSRQGPPSPLLSVDVAAVTAVDVRHHCHYRRVVTVVLNRPP